MLEIALVAEDAGAHPVLLVAVAAGRTDGMNRHQHARPENRASRNRIPQPDVDEVRAPDVSCRRNPGHDRLPKILDREQRLLGTPS